MLLELFGEFHPFEFKFFGLVGDGLKLVVELACSSSLASLRSIADTRLEAS